jgi:hypothetical protein
VTWFTRWGSWERKLCETAGINRPEVEDLKDCEVYLRGLGKENNPEDYEKLPYGHVFPNGIAPIYGNWPQRMPLIH